LAGAQSAPFRAYRVQPGDTIRFIAQTYGVSPASIAQASGLRNPDHLRVGDVLTIPSQPGWLYRIQPGETLGQIAARTGVPAESIVSASKLSNDTIQAGDVILIPEQSAARSK
jgi:LysM repeat protein